MVNGHLGLCGDGPGENGVADHDCWREDVDWSDPRRCLYHCLQRYMQYIVRNTLYELINNLIARNNEKGEYDREDTTRNDLQKIEKKQQKYKIVFDTWLSGRLVMTASGRPKPRKYGQLVSM